MRKSGILYLLVFSIVVSFFVLFGCQYPTKFVPPKQKVDELAAFEVNWDETRSIVCFGTSLTYGFVAEKLVPDTLIPSSVIWHSSPVRKNAIIPFTQADSAYPFCLDNKLRIKVYNEGHIGATVEQALSLLTDNVLTKKPALVLLEFSANDFLRDNNVTDVEQQMRLLIESIQNYGSRIVLISFVDQETIYYPPHDHPLYEKRYLARDYFNMLQRLANQYDLPFIKDCFFGIFGVDTMMSDHIHPDNEGYEKMADNIYHALYKTFELNGMLK